MLSELIGPLSDFAGTPSEINRNGCPNRIGTLSDLDRNPVRIKSESVSEFRRNTQLDRLSADWKAQYGHPILAVETFVDPEQFSGTVYTAGDWVELGQTDGWDIESGLHQRLDVSYNDDRCRIQSDEGILIFGIDRRIANSLFMQWRQAQLRPEHVTTTDFQTLMAEEHRRKALRLFLTKRPSIKNLS
jgi:Domain of unknown function (DUF4338)